MSLFVSVKATEWLRRLEGGSLANPFLRDVYGDSEPVLNGRRALWTRTLERFLQRFGDQPVRLFRSPGRINLRGMHVDTHGGYLNLMTHQRETVIAVAASAGSMSVVTNVEPEYPDVVFELCAESQGLDRPWTEFISLTATQERIQARRAAGLEWGNYVIGATLAAVSGKEGSPRGMVAAVGSDLPRGAALSSSAALCVALLHAACAVNGVDPDLGRLIRAEQDAEWYAGARVGMSDQGAMILGRRNHILNTPLFAEDLTLDGARYIHLPEDAVVLVVNSHTKRSLSGAQLVDYTRNRFAYSAALHVLRVSAAELGLPGETVAQFDRLSRLTPENLGGNSVLYRLLRRVPEEMTIDEMRARYAPPGLDDAYRRYFGAVPPELRPSRIRLRGPLAFGIAESERARQFADCAAAGDLNLMGTLMTLGHDGDRVVAQDGTPHVCDLSDTALHAMEQEGKPLSMCPGAYGASSPVLDLVVDSALSGGALGACLTGAGIAGAVIVLTRKADKERIAEHLQACLASDEYRRRGGRSATFSEDELRESVVANQSTAGAGELRF